MKEVSKEFVAKALPKRDPWSHKGDFGRLLVIGGSRTFSGAPALAALAALRAGCDLVKILAPERAADIAASFSPDIIAEPLRGGFLSNLHTRNVLEQPRGFSAVVIGNGIGTRHETISFLKKLITRLDKPCVIDADGLNAISCDIPLGNSLILTPHAGEFKKMTGEHASQDLDERQSQAKSLAKRTGAIVLLKGHVDIITDGHDAMLNKTGSVHMTKAGTGDVLAGIVGAFLAMGMTPLQSASSGAYISGLAGEIASKKLGFGMLSSDMLTEIPKAIASV